MRVRGIHPPRPARSRRTHLLAVPVLLSAALAAEYAVSSGAAAFARGAITPASSLASAKTTWVTTVPTGPAPSGIVTNCVVSSPDMCHTPQVFRAAYGIQSLLDRGIDGRGETITVVAPAPDPNAPPPPPGSNYPPDTTDIRQDLAAYDGEFGLPAARIEVVTALAGSASPWAASDEEAGNFEILHTVAPAATLRVIMLPFPQVVQSGANAASGMLAALRLAVSHTDVASMNWSVGEHYFTTAQVAHMNSILQWAAAHHVTVDAASGDTGASSDPYPPASGQFVKEVSLPASSPLVLGVGGTALTANLSTGAYIGETALHGPGGGSSGGGFSDLYARPGFQDGVPGTSTTRGVPDVSGAGGWGGVPYVAAADGKAYLTSLLGTSGSAPLWGGLLALANQYAHHHLGVVTPAIYHIARSPAYHQAFHDVTTGNNNLAFNGVTITGYQAAPGWDPVTGWGSPNAQVLIPLLAAARLWPGRSS